ncbi:MAG: hypothetical protein M3Y56_03880, partial [Armatimonadota bacterium]|nr:hypothetical protein [Armatimonadota bacterium]
MKSSIRYTRSFHGAALLWISVGSFLLAGGAADGATTAAAYRQQAEANVSTGQYAQAAQNFRSEAKIYRLHGDVNAAEAEEKKADRWTTLVEVYQSVPADRETLSSLYTHAKFEPVYGCYLGGYAEADDRLEGISGSDGQPMSREEALGQKLDKHLASCFTYAHYGENFPLNWAKRLSEKGIAPHVALEPNDGLDKVNDDEYLRKFAQDAASCAGPVFLRFAAEMNGDWTVYHTNPALYKTKFKLVHDVMARLAPNVAMIWCVNNIPEYNIPDYYPGDDSVDWVGVNFYSVLHHDNNASKPADFENPADMLQYVYKLYADRKPIAICEYGASHREKLNPDLDRSDAAATRFRQLFAALPRLFPRVKLMDIFDCDNLEHARPGRQLNDYSITDSDSVLAAVKGAVAPDYFLSTVLDKEQTNLPAYVRKLEPGSSLSGTASLSASIKTYDGNPTVIYRLDGKEAARLDRAGPYPLDLDTTHYSPGKHQLSVDVLD